MTTETKLPLETEDHWDDWEQELLRKATNNKVLPILQGTHEPLLEPVYPDLPEDLDPGPRPKGRMVPRTGMQRRSQSSSSTATPGPDDSIMQQPTEEEKKAYQERLEASKAAQSILNIHIHKYNADQKKFAEQEKGITAVREWIMKTASEHLKTVACNPAKSLREWYCALETAVGADKAFSKQKLRDRYERAVAVLTRTPKDLTAWITEWEHTMEKMSRKDLPEAKDSSQWFTRIQRASREIPELQSFFTVYQVVHKQEIENDTLNYNHMTSDLKKHLHANKATKTKGVGKGAFPAFGPNEEENEESEELKDQSRKGRKSNNKRKREDSPQGPRRGSAEGGPNKLSKRSNSQRPHQSDSVRPTCKACEKSGHELSECWDLFPELSPFPRSEWRIKKTMDQVNGNSKLKTEYDKLRAEKQKH